MGCPFLSKRPKVENPTEYPYESLYRPWSWILSSSGNLFVFAVFACILYALYRRRRGRSQSAAVSYRRVEVNSQTEQEGGVSVLVTGGNGVLGSALIECLLKEGGYKVHSLDLWIPEEADRNPQVCSYIQADVTNLDDMMLALNGIDAVFHTAGLVPTVKSSDADYYRVNTGGTRNIVEACKSCGVKRLIYTSSLGAVISNDPEQDLDGVDETIPLPETPVNAYAGSKAAAEILVREANALNGLVICIVRPAGLLSHASPFCAPYIEGSVSYVGDGLLVSNMFCIPVHAAARAHILAEQKLQQGQSSVAAGKVYNLCVSDRITYREFNGYEPNAPVSIWGKPPPSSVPFWVARIVCYLNRLIYICTGSFPFGIFTAPIGLDFLIRHSTAVFSSALAHKELGWEELPPWREIVKASVKEAERDTKKEQ